MAAGRATRGGERSQGRDSGGSGAASPAVRLEPVTAANRKAVLALALATSQEDLVADNASSLKEAKADKDARPRAIVAGDRVVGFLMYDPHTDDHEGLIYRFMIDHREQGRGYGRAALFALIDEVRGLGHVRDLLVCYMPDNEAARRLYHSAGFIDRGLDEDGEMIAHLSLAVRKPRR